VIHFLANHIWQSTLVAAAVAVLCFLLRRDGAHIRYWLWLTASVKFLVPFSLLTNAGQWIAGTTSLAPASLEVFSVVTIVAQPFAEVRPLALPVGVLLAVWLAGASFLLLRWWANAMRLRRVLACAEFAPAAFSCDGRPVGVYRTSADIEPGVVGWWRPVLLLPAGIEQRVSSAQLAAIVEHELHHMRRRDSLTATVHMLVEIVFWFYPVVWWIGSRLVEERERACDEMVVASGHDRRTYASSILDVCASYVASPLRSVVGISGNDLNRRMIRIMRSRGMIKLNRAKKLLLGFIGVVALAIPVFAGLQQAAQAQEEYVPPPMGSRQCEPGVPPRLETCAGDGDLIPVVKPSPRYPEAALAGSREGYVIVGYTVRADGSVSGVEVLESSSAEFEAPAVESVRGYEYVPRVIDGNAVDVSGVKTKIEFVLRQPEFGAAGGNDDQGVGDSDETLIVTGKQNHVL